MPLYAPNQNGLVERFNRVIAEKLKEAERFGWNIDRTIGRVLFDYRSTLYSTTGISPFEAMYGRNMRSGLSRLHPGLQEVPGKKIDRERVRQRQNYMKKNVESKKSPFEWDIQVGDWVRILKPDGWYRDYEEVTNVGQSSVTLRNGDTWPLFESAPRQIRLPPNKGT